MVNYFDMELHPIEKTIIQYLDSPETTSISDFGGIEYFYNNIQFISTSRFLPEILNLIANEIGSTKGTEREQSEKILLTSLRACNDAFSIQEVVSILEIAAVSINELKEACFLIYLEQSKNNEKDSLVRSWLLEAAFRISLSDQSKRFKLLSHLIEIQTEDCNIYLRHSSKILGLAYSSWQEKELIEKLEEIKVSQKGSDEVWFELGMSYLLNALKSETHEEAISNFILSKENFRRSVELGCERSDAVAYDVSISILLSLSDSKPEIDTKEALAKLSKAITIYSAWHISSNDNSWVSARNSELANWYILISKLEKLVAHLSEPCWYEPKKIIEKYLLNIYTASRTILKRNKSGGLEKIIQPKIESSLIHESNQLFLFEQWLTYHEESDLGEIGKVLKQEILSNKTQIPNNLIKAIPSITKLSTNKKSSFEQFVIDYKGQQTSDVSIKVEQIFNKSISSISKIQDYKNVEVERFFNQLLFHSLNFLLSRMDGTKKNHKELGYLFQQNPKPLEYELQKDYHQYMASCLLHGSISIEKSDVASGRVDVFFAAKKFNISAEIKRDWKDCSFETIKKKYLGQAAEYSNTDVKLGFLLILDLTQKPNGVRSIESNVKVEIIEKENDPIKRAIVVIVVPGMRKTPSKIKI